MRKRMNLAALGLLLMAAPVVADIPFFWLDEPGTTTGRDNPNDPKGYKYKSPTPVGGVPTAVPAGSATFTRTVTPYYSPTATPNPAFSSTWTLTPAPPSPTPTFTATPTQFISSTPTYTPGGHGALVADFTGGIATTLWGGGISSGADADGSSITLSSGSGSTLPGGSSAAALCMNGTVHAGPFPPYPYTNATLDLDSGGASVSIASYATGNSITFSYKANTLGPPVPSYRIRLASSAHADTDYYKWDFTPADTNWHTQTLYFPGSGGSPLLAQAGWGTAVPWANVWSTGVKAVEFVALENGGGAAVNYDLCVDDITFAPLPTATPTATPSNTPFYTPTFTSTPMAGFSGVWYDGDTAGAMAADVTFANETSTSTVSEAASGGYGGGRFYDVNYSVPAAGYFSSADIARPATDVSAFNQLELRLRVPATGGGCFNGGVQLVTNGTAPNDRSRPVTVTVYAASALAGDTWVHVRIPLTAFNGPNHETPSYSFSASDLANITAVRIRPYYNDYNADGSFTGAVDVDNVIFSVGAPAPAERTFGPLLANFETNTASSWGGYWSSYTDQDAPDFTCSPGTPTSRVFPATASVAPIVSDGAGAADTPCSYGRIAGTKGGPGDATGCGVNNWSYAGMGLNFDPAGGTASVDVPTAIGFTPSALRFRIKTGTNHQAGQQYIITLTLNAPQNTCGGCEWQLQFEPTATWQTVTAPFPTNGTVGTGVTPSQTAWGQPSWAGTPLTWDNTSWTLFRQVAIAPANSNQTFDVHWDDIEFIP